MGKVISICGRICSGKSTYARELASREGGIILSVDEIMLDIFGQHAGELHDEYAKRIKEYFLEKALLILPFCDVILDWGFPSKSERESCRMFFSSRGIKYELHYVDTPEKIRQIDIEKRNREILENRKKDYYIDENIKNKCEGTFEAPDFGEIDVLYKRKT